LDLLAIIMVSALLAVSLLETYEILRLRRRVSHLEREVGGLKEGLGSLGERVGGAEESLGKTLERISSVEEVLGEVVKRMELPVERAGEGGGVVRDPGDEIRRRVLELKVVNMYLGGVPVKEIVKEVGLSRATVYRILKKYRAL
jgi:predicted transcriptional regulator